MSELDCVHMCTRALIRTKYLAADACARMRMRAHKLLNISCSEERMHLQRFPSYLLRVLRTTTCTISWPCVLLSPSLIAFPLPPYSSIPFTSLPGGTNWANPIVSARALLTAPALASEWMCFCVECVLACARMHNGWQKENSYFRACLRTYA